MSVSPMPIVVQTVQAPLKQANLCLALCPFAFAILHFLDPSFSSLTWLTMSHHSCFRSYVSHQSSCSQIPNIASFLTPFTICYVIASVLFVFVPPVFCGLQSQLLFIFFSLILVTNYYSSIVYFLWSLNNCHTFCVLKQHKFILLTVLEARSRNSVLLGKS